MKLSQDDFFYTFTFQKDDWNTNLARVMMNAIKALPKKEHSYQPITKQWKVSVSDENKKVINDTYANWEKIQPTDIQLDLYDVQEDFLKQFGDDTPVMP